MRKITFLTIAFACLITTASCGQKKTRILGSSNYVTRTIPDPKQFDKIELIGSPDVEFVQAEATTLSVYSSDNVIDYVEVEVKNNVLTVKYKDNVEIAGKAKTKVMATGPSLKAVNLTGSGDVYTKGLIKGDKLTLSVTGSGDIEADRMEFNEAGIIVTGSGDIKVNKLDVRKVAAEVSGSGDIEIAGSSVDAEYKVVGSGDISADKLVSDNVRASVVGSGDVKCYAEKRLDASVSGSGDITYRGNAREVVTSGKKDNIRRK